MPLNIAVGKITQPGATGNQTITLAANFQPKAIIMWTEARTADGNSATADRVGFSVGAGTYRGGTVQQWTVGHTAAVSDPTAAHYAHNINTDAVLKMIDTSTVDNATPSIDLEIDLVSMGSNTVVVNFVNLHTTASIVINYIIFGGSQLDDAYAGSVASNTTTNGATQDVTVISGFGKPTFLFGAGAWNSAGQFADSINMSLGFGTQTEQYVCNTAFQDAAGTMIGASLQKSGAIWHGIAISAATASSAGIDYEVALASAASWPTDGFRLTYTDAPTTAGDLFCYLALRGAFNVDLNQVNTSTTVTTVANSNGLATGVVPVGAMFLSRMLAAATTIDVSNADLGGMMLGASDGTNNTSGLWEDEDASTTQKFRVRQAGTKSVTMIGGASGTLTTLVEASTTFSANNMNLVYSTVNATARGLLYALFTPAVETAVSSTAGMPIMAAQGVSQTVTAVIDEPQGVALAGSGTNTSYASSATDLNDGVAPWTSPSAATGASDGSIASASVPASSTIDTLRLSYSPSVPAGSTIVGLELLLDFRDAGGSGSTQVAWDILLNHSGVGSATQFFNSDGTSTSITLGGPTDLWGATSVTGITSVDIVVTNNAPVIDSFAELDSARLKVYYTGATGSPTVAMVVDAPQGVRSKAAPGSVVGYATTAQSILGTGNAWTNFSNATGAPDGSVATANYSNLTRTRLLGLGHSLSVPVPQIPVGVQVKVWASAGTSEDILVRLAVNGSTTGATVKTITPTTSIAAYTLGGPTDMWGQTFTDISQVTVQIDHDPSSAGSTFAVNIDAVEFTFFYDGTDFPIEAATSAGSGTPVSQTAVMQIDIPQGITATSSAVVQEAQGIASSAGTVLDLTKGVSTTASVVLDEPQGISTTAVGAADEPQGIRGTGVGALDETQQLSTTGQVPLEGPQGVAATGGSALDESGGIASPATGSLDEVQPVTSTRQGAVDAPQVVSSTGQSAADAPQGVAATSGPAVDMPQGVSSAGAAAADSPQGITATVIAPYEATGVAVTAVSQTATVAIDMVAPASSSGVSGVDAPQSVSATGSPVIEASKGVTASAGATLDEPGGIAQTGGSGLDSVQPISASAGSSVDEAKGVGAVTSATVVDATQGITSAGGSGLDSVQPVSATGISGVDAPQGVSATVVAPIEETGVVVTAVSQTAVLAIDMPGAVASPAGSGVDAPQGVSLTRATPLDEPGGIASISSAPADEAQGISATRVAALDAAQGVSATGVGQIDEPQGVTATRAEVVEAAQQITSAGVGAVDMPQGIIASRLTAVEAVQGVTATVVAPLEATGVVLTAVSQTVVAVIDITQAAAGSSATVLDAQQQVTQTRGGSLDTVSTVSSTAAGGLEAAAAVSKATGSIIDAPGGVARALGSPIDELAGIAAVAGVALEAVQAVSATGSAVLEALKGLETSVGLVVESTRGVASALVMPQEALAIVAAALDLPVESVSVLVTEVLKPVAVKIVDLSRGVEVADLASTIQLVKSAGDVRVISLETFVKIIKQEGETL